MRIPRVAGRTGDRTAFITTRPCRAPHHTISDVGLIGGGQVPLPGEVSLAHHGVLLLDARPACRRHLLEVLRQPLEEGVVTVAHVWAGSMLTPHPTLVKVVLARAEKRPTITKEAPPARPRNS